MHALIALIALIALSASRMHALIALIALIASRMHALIALIASHRCISNACELKAMPNEKFAKCLRESSQLQHAIHAAAETRT